MLFAAVSLLWGVPYLLVAEALDAGVGAFALVASRVVVGAAVLMVLVGGDAARLIHRTPLRVGVLALVEVAIPFTLIAVAERSVSSGTAGVLIALEPFFVLVWSGLIVRGKASAWARLVPGSVLGFTGVLVLLGAPGAGVGAWLLVAAAACYGLGAVLVARWFATEPSLPIAAAMLVVAAPIAVVVAGFVDGMPPASVRGVVAMVLLGAACTAGGFAAFFALIKTAGAHSASLITYVAPIVALAVGVAFRGESLTFGSVLGTTLVLAGAWICLRYASGSTKRRPASPPTPTAHTQGGQ
ncbi:DMT family transporter [Microlunatus ginsengisoli]|uniref:DMT family transporter n=1 Tax=Microlunatus ginsengisoli TaxID=363863 RepID=UPI0031E0117E